MACGVLQPNKPASEAAVSDAIKIPVFMSESLRYTNGVGGNVGSNRSSLALVSTAELLV
jgi:hypothetical protein